MTKERQPEHLTQEYQNGLVMPQRECRGCGVVFQPLHYSQRFHDVPCREDATVRSRHAKALEKAERSGWKTSERKCRGCRLVFQPRYVGQIYHDIPCRKKAHNRDQSDKRWSAKLEQERAREEAERLEKKRLVDEEALKREIVAEVMRAVTIRKMEPLLALAEQAATAEGYEFETLPDSHPRWASPDDLRRSSALNRPGAIIRSGTGSWWVFKR